MDKKTVSKILKGKHIDFLKSIKDNEIRDLIDKNSIITGGAIVSLLMGEQVNDFDYYFTDPITCKRVAEYFVKEFQSVAPIKVQIEEGRVKIVVPSRGVEGEAREVTEQPDDCTLEAEDSVEEKYKVVFLSSNAITLSNKIQLVIRFCGDPEQIHKNYDFIHCTNYWVSKTGELVLNQPALESILAKRLYYVGSLYPLSSIIRIRKFIQRGWRINAGQILKMIFQCNDLDLKDINVLEDQLVGVDCAYFFQVIEWCKKKQEEDPKFILTTPYLIGIIDKIF